MDLGTGAAASGRVEAVRSARNGASPPPVRTDA
jgi:hypothetical protein